MSWLASRVSTSAFASLVTLALNVADPLLAGKWGKAAFDSVGPLLLIGWAHVGPELLHALTQHSPLRVVTCDAFIDGRQDDQVDTTSWSDLHPEADHPRVSVAEPVSAAVVELLEQARELDAEHWTAHQRPISAETLRRELKIGAQRARVLVSQLRNEHASGRQTHQHQDKRPIGTQASSGALSRIVWDTAPP